MSLPAELIAENAAQARASYEQPLNERMRTMLRLEYLYRQLAWHVRQESPWSSHSAVSSLLDIMSVLTRGDVRGEILKELERQLYVLDRFQQSPQVDEGRLSTVLSQLGSLRRELVAAGPQYLQPLRDSEFLSMVRHRSAIPGGTCEFDLPDYSHWLRQEHQVRLPDLQRWISVIQPLCASVVELLFLIRETGETTDKVAAGGVYQHVLPRDTSASLLRISLPSEITLYPEISGGHHRFSIRFMEWRDGTVRPAQTTRDISFSLTVC